MFTISTIQDIGQRLHQEDRLAVKTTGARSIIGVFDGHRGDKCAKACATHINELPWDTDNTPSQSIVTAYFDALRSITHHFEHVGCTASIVHVIGTTAHIGIIGDSPVFILDEDRKVHQFATHNLSDARNEHDIQRARVAGGVVRYSEQGTYLHRTKMSGPGLAMTAALGDNDFGDVIRRTPDVYTVENVVGIAVLSDGYSAAFSKTQYLLHERRSASAFIKAQAEGHGIIDNFTAVVAYNIRDRQY